MASRLPSPESTGTDPPALTRFSHGAGCGCKLASAELRAALGSMHEPVPTSGAVVVGVDTSDDAGVVRLDGDRALVHTVDFFTPVVDDAGTWGRIAAVNALSDVYAMGGSPLSALNIVAWPRDRLPWTVLGEVLDGAARALAEAGCALVGGHSVDDPEPKFGLAVTGLVDLRRLLTNAGGAPGDDLVLTKALGTGALTTALKQGRCREDDLAPAVASMSRLNDVAASAAVRHGVRGATDVTGFGLIGHLGELAAASGVSAEVCADALPELPGALALIEAGAVSGGTRRNLAGADAAGVDWGHCPPARRLLACDAQTSGGLLLATPPAETAALVARLGAAGQPAWVIGGLGPADPDGPVIRVR